MSELCVELCGMEKTASASFFSKVKFKASITLLKALNIPYQGKSVLVSLFKLLAGAQQQYCTLRVTVIRKVVVYSPDEMAECLSLKTPHPFSPAFVPSRRCPPNFQPSRGPAYLGMYICGVVCL